MSDLVSIVEAAYRTDADDASWLDAVLGEIDATLGRGLGTCGLFLDASNLAALRAHGLDRSRLQIDLDPRVFSEASASEVEPYYGAGAAGTGSGQIGGARPWRRSRLYRAYWKPAGAEDVIGIIALDATRVGCVLAIPCTKVTRLSAREELVLSRIAAHVATGRRIRLARTSTAPDAILTGDGNVVHAEGEATGRGAREALRHLAIQIDRARASLRRSDADEALAVWTALVEGRWTLLDHFDSDGRRYLVARRNDPDAPPIAPLTTLETQVVAYTALGHSGKLTAYELGLPAPTISRTLGSAMAKLGIASKTELVAALARFAAASVGGQTLD